MTATNPWTDPAYQKAYGQIVAQAWADPACRQRLLADPAAVLAEAGVRLSPGTKVRVIEDAEPDTFYFYLPPPPTSDELSDELLAQATGGARTGETRLQGVPPPPPTGPLPLPTCSHTCLDSGPAK